MNPIYSALLDALGLITVQLLSVLGLLVVMVFAVWGTLKVYAVIQQKDSEEVAYQIGRLFGEEIYEQDYSDFKKKKRSRERNARFERRYRSGK